MHIPDFRAATFYFMGGMFIAGRCGSKFKRSVFQAHYTEQ